VKRLHEKFGTPPVVVMTSARKHIADECGKPLLSYQEARKRIRGNTTIPYIIVLGTGYGVEHTCVRDYSHGVLAPIHGVSDYNHLSVRSAAAIMIDRLFGRHE
jgi:hypothetical protein